MDDFTSAYIECAIWSSDDESTLLGDTINLNYDWRDLDPQTKGRMVADYKKFQEENSDDIATWKGDTTCDEQAGHDFWLNRNVCDCNGCGNGFWEPEWEGEPGSRLDKASRVFGEYHLYVENDTIFGE